MFWLACPTRSTILVSRFGRAELVTQPTYNRTHNVPLLGIHTHTAGHKPPGKHKSRSLASSRTHGFAHPPHPDETPAAGRGTSTPASVPRPRLESDPPLSSAQEQQQQQRSRSPSDELHAGVKGPSQLLARGRMHFNTGSGGTSHMFASSPKGVRAAARRARSFQRHASASSAWAAQSDAPKREDSMLKSLTAERDGAVESPVDAAEEAVGGAQAVEEGDAVGGEGVGPPPLPPRPKEALSPSSQRAADSSNGGLVGRRSPMPLSFVPLAPAPPLLSGATNTVQPKTSSGGIDTVSSASSEALNSGRDSRRAQAAAMAAAAPSSQSPNGVSLGNDLVGPEGGGRDTPSPTLALARAGLRSVPKEHRREPRAVAAAAAEKAISMVGKSVETGGSVEADSSSGSGSGSGVLTDREDSRGGRSSPDSFYSDGSGDSSRGSGRRTHSKVLELEERRAALVAASLRTSALPPPPPPRLLSQASRDANGFLRGEVTRPKPTKLLARSRTTVAETTTSSSSKLAGRSVAAAFLSNRPQGSGEDDPCEVIPLRPEMRARQQPRKPQQQQNKKSAQQTGGEGSTTPTATTSTAIEQQQKKVVVKFPTSLKPRGGAPRDYSPPPPGVKPTSPFGAGAATGGSVRSLVPGPRLVLAGASFDADPKVSTAAPPVGGGGDRRHGGMLLVSRGSMDDLPPAEMGALGVSLVCTMCGRKERKREAGVREANGGVGDSRKGGKGVEMARCARCRKGCCQACLKHLPAHCRGPKIVIPGEFLGNTAVGAP